VADGAPDELATGVALSRVSWRDAAGERHVRETGDPTALLHELSGAALDRGERLEELTVTRPSLEDVYLELTEAASADAGGVAA
jgi:ABC-2 type transport system ATP-binding protein